MAKNIEIIIKFLTNKTNLSALMYFEINTEDIIFSDNMLEYTIEFKVSEALKLKAKK